jgi:hypothetical protein
VANNPPADRHKSTGGHKSAGGRVFVNCPFTAAHRGVFDALVFTLVYYNFKPILAQHRKGGGRLEFIRKQVDECAFSIHDITPLTGKDGGARQNTAFELGLWLGAKRDDDTLIFIAEERTIAASFSDLKGHDCLEHGGDDGEVVRQLAQHLLRRGGAGTSKKPAKVESEYRQFCVMFESDCKEWGWKQTDDLAARAWLIREWLLGNL